MPTDEQGPERPATPETPAEHDDSGLDLAHVPVERVLELGAESHGLRPPESGVPMLSYLDAGLLSPGVIAEWQRLNGTIYSDSRSAYQVGMWVNRVEQETTVTAAFPSNPIARESVLRYLQAMKSVYLSVVEGRGVAVAAIAADTVDLDLKTA